MKCPGQDTQFWTENAIYQVPCPSCGAPVEFFKDDTARTCGKCGHRFANPKMDFGCAAYCQFAEQCIGTLPPEVVARQGDLLKDRVAVEMKRYFKSDFKRISHAMRVARYAERIAETVTKGNRGVILISAYLHDIGIHEAERKHGSTAARFQELEGPPVARSILVKLGAPGALIDEVCDIVGHHHHPRETETANYKAVYDADLIANLEDTHPDQSIDPHRLESVIRKTFLTKGGAVEARRVLLKG